MGRYAVYTAEAQHHVGFSMAPVALRDERDICGISTQVAGFEGIPSIATIYRFICIGRRSYTPTVAGA